MTKDKNNINHIFKAIILGIAIFTLGASIFVINYKFDNSLSFCACKPVSYKPTSFILNVLTYKHNVYASEFQNCMEINTCLDNFYIFPIDLIVLSTSFLGIYIIIKPDFVKIKKTRLLKK